MPSVTTAHKVPQPLGSDPVQTGDDVARSLATYLEGIPITSLGSLASGWTGTVEVERSGLFTIVYVNVAKASYTVNEAITSGVKVPVGSRPRKLLYGEGTDPAAGRRRRFSVDTAGSVNMYGYDDAALTGGVIGHITYLSVPA